MNEEPTPPEAVSPFAEYTVEIEGIGLLTILDPEGEPGYRARLPDGQVTAFPAVSGEPSPENAATDIAHALANPPLPPPPPRVTRRQLLLAVFRLHGRTEADILAAIAAIPDDATRYEAGVEFAAASTIERAHPLVDQIATACDLSSEDADAIFRLAATL